MQNGGTRALACVALMPRRSTASHTPSMARAISLFGLLLTMPTASASYCGARTIVSRGSSRCRSPVAMGRDSGPIDVQTKLSDLLMNRAVEVQLSAYSMIRNAACKTWLLQTWEGFLDDRIQHRATGGLTDFLDLVVQREPERIFVPTRKFRRLSPSNPHAADRSSGFYSQVEPSKVALQLISVRESLAERWSVQLRGIADASASATSEQRLRSRHDPTFMRSSGFVNYAGGEFAPLLEDEHGGSTDEQLLRALATSIALREVLHDLSLYPSRGSTYQWLSSFCLDTHADNLTPRGSVEALLHDLVAQPPVIREGTIIDPTELHDELCARAASVSAAMATDLQQLAFVPAQRSHSFLESCFRL